MIMDFKDSHACFDNTEYCFVSLVEHLQTGASIVICTDDKGSQKCIEADLWEKLSRPSCPSQEMPTEQTGETRLRTAASHNQPDRPIADHSSTSAEKLAVFRWLFRGREDVYAHGYFNKKSQRIGYTPACANEWVKPFCDKKSVRCANCEHRVFLPLDDRVLIEHFRGVRSDDKDVIGMYPMTINEEVFFLAADFDKKDWAVEALAYIDAGRELGIPVYLERSRSGNGGHAWIFFEDAVAASLARKLGCLLVSRAMESRRPLPFSAYDRFFPNQDGIEKDGFGNLIALPLQGRAFKKGNSMFVDDGLEAYADQWKFLSSIQKIPTEAVEQLVHKDASSVLGSLVQNKEKPWKRQTRATLAPLDFAGIPEVVEANMLYVDKRGMSANAINRIRRLAAFANKDFYRAQAMKLSVKNVSRIIYAGSDTNEYIGLPRGCKSALAELLETCGTSLSTQDERSGGKLINVEFVGTLRPLQVKAARALLSSETGVLSASPSFGKTIVSAYLIAQRRVSTLILVPSTSLIKQWRERLEAFLSINEELPELLTKTGRKSRKKRSLIGQMGANKDIPSGIVDIAIPASLFEKTDIAGEQRMREIVNSYGMVICDECHHVPAAKYLQVVSEAQARYVYGMTATPMRKDQLDPIIFMQCGPIRYKFNDADQLRDQGMVRIMVPRFTRFSMPANEQGTSSFAQLLEAACADTERNRLIIEDAAQLLDEGSNPLVLTRRVAHAEHLYEQLTGGGREALLLVGSDNVAVKNRKLQQLKERPVDNPLVVIATGDYLGEGFDDSRFDVLLLAAPIAWKGLVVQYAGRIHRTREGKNEVIIYDYVDARIAMFDKMYRGRVKQYRKLGYEAQVDTEDEAGRSAFYTADDFSDILADDVSNASSSIWIASVYLNDKRVDMLVGTLGEAARRGVEVTICIGAVQENTKAHDSFEHSLLLFEEYGISIERAKGRQLNLAIIDERLVWYGDINFCAFNKKDACSLRFESASVANDLLKTANSC